MQTVILVGVGFAVGAIIAMFMIVYREYRAVGQAYNKLAKRMKKLKRDYAQIKKEMEKAKRAGREVVTKRLPARGVSRESPTEEDNGGDKEESE
jgi:hypothetical protein